MIRINFSLLLTADGFPPLLVFNGITNEFSVLDGVLEACVDAEVTLPVVVVNGNTVPKANGNGSANTARLLGGSTAAGGRRHSAIEYRLFDITIPPLPSALVDDEFTTPLSLAPVARVLFVRRNNFNIRFLTDVANGSTDVNGRSSLAELFFALNECGLRTDETAAVFASVTVAVIL